MSAPSSPTGLPTPARGRSSRRGLLLGGAGGAAGVVAVGTAGRAEAAEVDPGAAARPRLTQQYAAPLYVAHRGGGQIHGEHSREAYDYSARNGFAIELDLYRLADGRIACVHDATTARTMVNIATGQSNVAVSSITSVEWKRDWRVLPRIAGADLEQPMLLEDVLDLYGGRVLVVPELKVSTIRDEVVEAFVSRRLQDAVLLQSFTLSDVTYAASKGLPAMRLGGQESGASLAAAGIRWVGLDAATLTDARIADLRAAGVKVVAYTVNTRHAATTGAAALLARGVHGVFSDDPGWVSGRHVHSYADPYAARVPWAHLYVTNGAGGVTNTQVSFRNGGIAVLQPESPQVALVGRSIAQDWCPPVLSGKAQVDFEVEFLPTTRGDASRWAGIAFGRLRPDETYADLPTAGQDCWHVLMRRNGQLQVYSILAGAGPALRASVNGTATAPLDRQRTMRFSFIRDASQVRLVNRDTGESVTWASTTLWAGSRFAFTVNSTNVVFKNVSVTPL